MTDRHAIIDTYRWHRGLGHSVVLLPNARVIVDTLHPNVWDANHVDAVSAATEDEIEEVLGAFQNHLAHSDWRVIHTDPLTPDAFVARLALDGFEEQPAVIQMALRGGVRARATAELRLVSSDDDWNTLSTLVMHDHSEGARTGGVNVSRAVSDGIVAGYRVKAPACQFFLAIENGVAVAYGSWAAGPSGAGIIEDLFTLPTHRGRGIASAMIRACSDRLHDEGCSVVFLGALVGERARHLYAKLGFQPVMLTRTWAWRVVHRHPNGS